MNSRPTIQQYRRLAEGLLRKALEAPLESKQDFIHHAMSHYEPARQFLSRGIEKVRAEWAMICTVHNLRKLALAAA